MVVLFGGGHAGAVSEDVWKEAELQGVLPLVWGVQENAAAAERAMHIMKKSIQVNAAHAEIQGILGDDCTVIKGCASARYYPEPGYRTMGDVDVLVSDPDAADARMTANGWKRLPDTSRHHHNYEKNGIKCEVHIELPGIPGGQTGEKVRKAVSDLQETAVSVDMGFGTLRVPDDRCHGVILLLHMAHHIQSSGFGLRHLCDWAVFTDRVPDFPKLMQKTLEDIGLWNAACVFTALCTRYLGLPEQPWCGAYPDAFLQPLMDEIERTGNFGQKSPHDLRGHFFTVTENGLERRKGIAGIFSLANQVTRSYWPIARRCPLVLPAGWVVFGAKYLARLLRGKRQNVLLGLRLSRQQHALYKRLRLFEGGRPDETEI